MNKIINITSLLIVTLTWMFPILGHAQTQSEENAEKYWYYRNRLRNKFMLIGEGCGKSIPAGKVAVNTQYPFQTEDKIEWGDAPNKFGWYLGVLATEWHLLNQARKCTHLEQTEKELYYALKAFQRLDRYAETYFRRCQNGATVRPCQGVTICCQANGYLTLGFAIRDDVDSSFIYNHQSHFDYFNFSNGVEVSSGWEVSHRGDYIREMSQDHLTRIFMGLALIVKYVDPSASYNGQKLRKWAKSQAELIFNKLKETNWFYTNPITEKCAVGVNSDQHTCTDVSFPNCSAGGSDVRGFSFSFAKAMCMIDNSFDQRADCSHYFDFYTTTVDEAWLTISTPTSFKEILTFKIKILGETISIFAPHDPRLIMDQMTIGDIAGYIRTQRTLMSLARDNSFGGWYTPYVHAALYGIEKDDDGNNVIAPSFVKDTIQRLLNTAPRWGPRGFHVTPNWRKEGGPFRTGGVGSGSFTPMQLPGLDYMLMYNLQQILFPNAQTPNIAYCKHKQDGGNKRGKRTLRALRTIRSDATIHTSANINYRAGYEITLKPGFHAEAGSQFHAKIDQSLVVPEYTPIVKTASTQSVNTMSISPQKQDNAHTRQSQDTTTTATRSYQPGITATPNPTEHYLNFRYTVAHTGKVRLTLQDINGEVVARLLTNEPRRRGTYHLRYNARQLSPGIYLYSYQTERYRQTGKVVVVR